MIPDPLRRCRVIRGVIGSGTRLAVPSRRGACQQYGTRTFPRPSCHEHCVRVHLYYLVSKFTCSQCGFCSHGTGETQHEVVEVLSALSGSVLCDVQNVDMKCNLQLGQSYSYIYSNDVTMHFELLNISNCLKRRTYRCRNTVQETC